MAPENTEILIPLVHSDKGYTYLLNAPGYGTVCVDNPTANVIQWTVKGAIQLDLWVMASPPRQVGDPSHLRRALSAYHAVTGLPSPFPEWTAGFWSSKNRYRNQSEVEGVIATHARLGIPLAALVIDMGAWNVLGDEEWGGCTAAPDGVSCQPLCWPDPAKMRRDAEAAGVQLILSPYFNIVDMRSVNYAPGVAARAFAMAPPKGGDVTTTAACLAYNGYNRSTGPRPGCTVPPQPYCGQGCLCVQPRHPARP
jgi:alpha-glucosidase (family GH31 glycosyl hydrolase)